MVASFVETAAPSCGAKSSVISKRKLVQVLSVTTRMTGRRYGTRWRSEDQVPASGERGLCRCCDLGFM
jgi:hypothetical protein